MKDLTIKKLYQRTYFTQFLALWSSQIYFKMLQNNTF